MRLSNKVLRLIVACVGYFYLNVAAVFTSPQSHNTYLLLKSSALPGREANLSLIEHLAMKTSGFITLLLVMRFKSQSILSRGKKPRLSPNKKLGVSDIRPERFGKETYFWFCRYSKQDSPTVQPTVSSYPSSIQRN
jgi:hypothetical protein